MKTSKVKVKVIQTRLSGDSNDANELEYDISNWLNDKKVEIIKISQVVYDTSNDELLTTIFFKKKRKKKRKKPFIEKALG